MNQHLVSRVLLRQWTTGKPGRVSGLDLDTLKQRTGPVESFGAVDDLITKNADAVEQQWQKQVEGKLNHPLQLVAAGTIIDPANAKYVEVLKDCLALHWARSFAVMAMMKRLQPKYVDQMKQNILSRFTGTQAIEAMTGLTIPEPAASELLHQKIAVEFDQTLSDEVIASEFEKHRMRAKEMIGSHGLEFLVATESEFLIGDCPVVTIMKGTEKGGPLNGVAWGNADAVFMPIGPLHAISLSQTNRYANLGHDMVVTLNRMQVQAALKEIYFRPGSGLGDQIAEDLQRIPSQ